MLLPNLKKALRFYFITDDASPDLSPVEQAKIAVSAGAGMIQYRNKTFSPKYYDEVIEIRDICKSNHVPLIINDDIVLAKAVNADGVHVGQEDEKPGMARAILGSDAIVGASVSTPEEFHKTDLVPCDYIGVGPVFQTGTKTDAKPVIGLRGLKAVADMAPVPVVAIGGIDESNAGACFENGASGVAMISAISRSQNPEKSANKLARICNSSSRRKLNSPWKDEFGLIEKLISKTLPRAFETSRLILPPGDDTCLFKSLSHPVVTTDTQREGVHFSFTWQTPEEVGEKAVEITLSDLAAAYAEPVGFFINLGLPPFISDATVEALYEGIHSALGRHHCELGGGNISGAERLSLDLFALGQGRKDIIPVRSKAKRGYGLYCTGPLGMARAGLLALMKKDIRYQRLIETFKFPKARFDAAAILADHKVLCVMDISDGLAGDATHIAKASGISVKLDISQEHVDKELIQFCDQYDLSPKDMAMAGGEDYELLFACPPKVFEQLRRVLKNAYCVGECLPFNGKYLINPPKLTSFQHSKK